MSVRLPPHVELMRDETVKTFSSMSKMRSFDAKPIEFREVLRLARIGGVRQRQRVAGAAVEGFAQMHDLRAFLFARSLLEVLADFPIERCLDGVLDAEGTAFDEE